MYNVCLALVFSLHIDRYMEAVAFKSIDTLTLCARAECECAFVAFVENGSHNIVWLTKSVRKYTHTAVLDLLMLRGQMVFHVAHHRFANHLLY